jgi:molybdopterin-containing oxidoreductase family iron-sulfur binding subunit
MFGDMNNPEAQIAAWKGSPLNYALLEDLQTHPRTTYLAEVRNPHDGLKPT